MPDGIVEQQINELKDRAALSRAAASQKNYPLSKEIGLRSAISQTIVYNITDDFLTKLEIPKFRDQISELPIGGSLTVKRIDKDHKMRTYSVIRNQDGSGFSLEASIKSKNAMGFKRILNWFKGATKTMKVSARLDTPTPEINSEFAVYVPLEDSHKLRTIQEEYRHMVELHAVDNDHFVEPISISIDKNPISKKIISPDQRQETKLCTKIVIRTKLYDQNLADFVESNPRELVTKHRADILQQLSYAINLMHKQANKIHRDLKPENIYLKYDSSQDRYIVKIGDPEFALDLNTSNKQEYTALLGTPGYMPIWSLLVIEDWVKNIDQLKEFSRKFGFTSKEVDEFVLNSCVQIMDSDQSPENIAAKIELFNSANTEQINNWMQTFKNFLTNQLLDVKTGTIYSRDLFSLGKVAEVLYKKDSKELLELKKIKALQDLKSKKAATESSQVAPRQPPARVPPPRPTRIPNASSAQNVGRKEIDPKQEQVVNAKDKLVKALEATCPSDNLNELLSNLADLDKNYAATITPTNKNKDVTGDEEPEAVLLELLNDISCMSTESGSNQKHDLTAIFQRFSYSVSEQIELFSPAGRDAKYKDILKFLNSLTKELTGLQAIEVNSLINKTAEIDQFIHLHKLDDVDFLTQMDQDLLPSFRQEKGILTFSQAINVLILAYYSRLRDLYISQQATASYDISSSKNMLFSKMPNEDKRDEPSITLAKIDEKIKDLHAALTEAFQMNAENKKFKNKYSDI